MEESHATLKEVYEKATKKYVSDYEEVLWAVAAAPEMERRSKDVYWKSYKAIAGKMGKNVIPLQKFYNRMNSLKRESHGEILVSARPSWYKFRESIVRGYVRLQAEKNGIELGADHYFADKNPFM